MTAGREGGSSSLGMVAAMVVVAVMVALIGIDLALVSRARATAQAAAEGGALAAVGAASEGLPPAVAARRVVAANGARVVTCRCADRTVRVEVVVGVAPLLLDRLGLTQVRASAEATMVRPGREGRRAPTARPGPVHDHEGNAWVVHSFTWARTDQDGPDDERPSSAPGLRLRRR